MFDSTAFDKFTARTFIYKTAENRGVMRRGRLWLNSPQACAFSSKKNSDFYSRVEINIQIMSENIISGIVIVTNEMIIQRFSDVLLAASHFHGNFFSRNDTKMLGCRRESVYIGLTSTQAAKCVYPVEGKLQIKRDRKRFLFSVQGNGSWERAVR
ncbi:hypothetical protein [Kluyvera sichuanensis]